MHEGRLPAYFVELAYVIRKCTKYAEAKLIPSSEKIELYLGGRTSALWASTAL